jgi:hypothetical protein
MANAEIPEGLLQRPDPLLVHPIRRSSTKLMRQILRRHGDVLQTIEFVLVTRFQEDSGMDDRAASAALRACLCDGEPVETRIAEIVEGLSAVRDFRLSVSDEVWRDALRVVDDSVHRHSKLLPGESTYLEFAAQFLG